MTCAACVQRVEKVLSRVGGVSEARVNLATHRATVEVETTVDESVLIAAVERAGYTARARNEARERERETEGGGATVEARRAIVAGVISGVAMVVAMVPSVQFTGHGWVQLGLALGVLLGPGFALSRSAVKSARHGEATMDTLVALGAWAAVGVSLPMLAKNPGHVGHGHYWFETAAMIVAFVLVGRWIESGARRKTGDALRALAALRPTVARRVRADGGEEELSVERLKVGDRVRVGAHQKVPVDGVVRSGTSHVDASLVTGESLPVRVTEGTEVVGGTVNHEGAIEVEVTRVGSESVLEQIVVLVERAQGSKAPVQRAADRAAGVFVPVVMAVSAVTLALAWGVGNLPLNEAFLRAVTVLVVACPCALGLATPTAVVVGTGAAARRGILFRDAAALEALRTVNVVAFDKTGTVTEGRPAVTEVVTVTGQTEREVLGLAAAVERESEHPLARAVIDAAVARGVGDRRATEVEVKVGEGVSGRVDGETVWVGLCEVTEGELSPALVRLRAEGRSVAVVKRDGESVAAVAFEDPVREGARDAVAGLRDKGIEVHLVTGDHAVTARAVGVALGVEAANVHSEQKPQDKVTVVKSLRAKSGVVAMVGDGVNDAPALAEADVGVAMGGGTAVATAVAAVTLTKGDPRAFVEAIELSRATMRAIRQNLGWAFGYNAVGIPAAAFGVLEHLGGPMFAAAAMALSSITVVGNALRLKGALNRQR